MMTTMVVLLAWAPQASAYSQYSPAKGGQGNCASCHGDFNGNAGYVSLQDADPTAWPTDTMNSHSNDMLQGTCAACHGSGAKYPVLMGSSNDPVLNMSCMGCHGRVEDANTLGIGTAAGSTGYGAGLRQAHFRANRNVTSLDDGVTIINTQICVSCHGDADPANFATAAENTIPVYYTNPTISVTLPTDPCNTLPGTVGNPGGESLYGTLGLDNDGNGLIDTADAECAINAPPVADATPAAGYTASVGTPVNLDGGQSSDPNGDPLTWSWEFTAVPSGSGLSLGTGSITQDGSAIASFTPDRNGTYTVLLTVTDDGLLSSTDVASISTTNNPPVAIAGGPYSGTHGSSVTLTGSASEPDGDAIAAYSWALTVRPTGSGAALTSTTTATTSFTIDVSGTYQVELVVTDEWLLDSAPSTATITTSNTVPTAIPGGPYPATPGFPVNLTGSAIDPDIGGELAQSLTYLWSFTSVAAGSGLSSADITQDGSANASFTPDVEGTFIVQLIVNDGVADSPGVTTNVNTVNTLPVANAGDDQSVIVGALVTLIGSASSDADGHPITWLWTFVSGPEPDPGLSSYTATSPTFTANLAGTYTWQLVVSDPYGSSAADLVDIVVGSSNTAPAAVAGGPYSAVKDGTVNLDGSASSDPDAGDTLTYSWAFISVAPGSGLATANISQSPSSPLASFVIDVSGDYSVQLSVQDNGSPPLSASDTATVSTINSAPTAHAGDPQTVNVGQTVNLDGINSADVDGDNLTYAWSLSGVPTDSTLTTVDITQGGTRFASFVPDVKGDYLVQLIVTDDGTPPLSSNPASDPNATVTITTNNSAPVAAAGPDQLSVPLGGTVNLDGGGSYDPDFVDTIAYSWSFTSVPTGSTLTNVDIVQSPSLPLASFTTDVKGDYTVQLTVTDDAVVPKNSSDTMVARVLNSVPTAIAGPDQAITDGGLVTLDGSGSFDDDPGETATLSYNWSFDTKPGGSAAVLNTTDPLHPTFVADGGGLYRVKLTVSDGFSIGAADLVDITNTLTSAQPDIVLAPASHDYGTVLVGTTQTTNVAIQNLGTNVLNVTGLTMSGADFAYSGPGLPINISTGYQVSLEVTYTPGAAGASVPGLLTVTSDDPDQPTTSFTFNGSGIAGVPAINLPTPSVVYGDVAVATTKTALVAIQNQGTANLNITNLAVTGSTDFALPSGTPTSYVVEPGRQVTVQVNYTPGEIGPDTGSLAITSDDPGSPASVSLDGNGVSGIGTPTISQTPSIDFGDVLAGSWKREYVAIQNLGTSNLEVTSLALTGSADFAFFNAPSTPFTIKPGRQASFRVQYTASAGPASGSVDIVSDDPANPSVSVLLSGNGIGGTQSINAPASVVYGDIVVGSSKREFVAIHNNGTVNLTVNSLVLSGSTNFALVSPPTGSFIIKPGRQVSIKVNFTPSATGAAAGSLAIDGDIPTAVSLSGNGIGGTPAINLPTLAVVYGDVEVGNTQTVLLAIQNQGTGNLNVTDLVVTGSTDFALPSGAPTSYVVEPGRQVTVQVNYTPGELGADTGALAITSDDPGSPASVSLDGNGTAVIGSPTVFLPTTSVAYGTVLVGTTKSVYVAIQNQGTADLNVAGLALTGSTDFALPTGTPTSYVIAPGRQASIRVNYQPSAVGAVSGALAFTTDDTGNPSPSVSLDGTGEAGVANIAMPVTTYDFGDVVVGTSKYVHIPIQNSGTGDLTVTNVTLTGSGFFTLPAGTPTTYVIAPGRQVTVKVIYTPTAEGIVAGTLTVDSDDGDQPSIAVPVSGNGVPAV